MSWFLLVIFILLFLYACMLLWFSAGFRKTETFKTPGSFEHAAVSIIICARNEEKNIRFCLQSIIAQEYNHKKIQLILVDDNSSDNTLDIAISLLQASGLDHQIISNSSRQGKKKSILLAMKEVKYPLVVTRDADTFSVSKKWLSALSSFYASTSADLIIGPVVIADHAGLLWALQAGENNILSVFSAGSAHFKKPFLCSGANLCFTRQAFERAGSYTSHLEIASGDDVLFLEDLKRTSNANIQYLKSADALVYTYPCRRFGELLQQKVRWASKFRINPNVLNSVTAIMGFLINLLWLICFISLSFVPYKLPFQLFVFFKLTIDILLLFLASSFIKNKNLLWYSLPVACIYPVYACIVGVASLLVKPKWK